MNILVTIATNILIVLVFLYTAVWACGLEVLPDMIIGILAGIGMLATSIIVSAMAELCR